MSSRIWTFFDFLDERGENTIAAWLSSLPPEAQAKIDDRLVRMAQMDRWVSPWCKFYKGYDQIVELRILINKVQYRPLGFYGPRQREFTLLIGAIERNNKISRSVLETAVKRKDLVCEDRRYICKHEL